MAFFPMPLNAFDLYSLCSANSMPALLVGIGSNLFIFSEFIKADVII